MNPRWIYISPHLDDAVLSCGGMIHEQTRQGIPVETWTLICGVPCHQRADFPIAQLMHFQWGTGTAQETVTLRREEDRAPPRSSGRVAITSTPRTASTAAVPRGSRFTRWMSSSLRHPLEAGPGPGIAREMETALLPDDILVCPLTIGGHVDHVLTRQAVERLGRPPWYYADIPYLLKHPEELAPATADMQAELPGVSEAGLHAWQDGIAAYKSQINDAV